VIAAARFRDKLAFGEDHIVFHRLYPHRNCSNFRSARDLLLSVGLKPQQSKSLDLDSESKPGPPFEQYKGPCTRLLTTL
jgi:hypothetical protein